MPVFTDFVIPPLIFHSKFVIKLKCAPTGNFAQLEHVLSVAHLRNDHVEKAVPETNHYFALSQQPFYGVAA